MIYKKSLLYVSEHDAGFKTKYYNDYTVHEI